MLIIWFKVGFWIVIVFVIDNGLVMIKGKKIELKKLFYIYRIYL